MKAKWKRVNRKMLEEIEKLPGKIFWSSKEKLWEWERRRKLRENWAKKVLSMEHKISPKTFIFSTVFSTGSSGSDITLSSPPASWKRLRNWTCCKNSPRQKRHKTCEKWIKSFMSRVHNSHPEKKSRQREEKLENDLKSFFMQETCLSSVMRR